MKTPSSLPHAALSRRAFSALALATTLLSPLAFAQEVQGISKDEILLGSVQDLSGPLVAVSKPLMGGMTMRIEEINAAGGIHGRKLKLLIEDSSFDPKKAIVAVQKLVSSDKVFAVVGSAGTGIALATAPLVVDKGVLHLFPAAAAREVFEPVHKYKFAMLTPYDTETRAGLEYLLATGKYKRVGILYQDEAFGLDVLRATEAVLKENKLPLVEKTSYKRGATDFSSQVQRLKEANVDLVVLGAAVRETVGAVTALRQLGYTGDFMGTQGTFHKDVPKMGGAAMEGLMSVSGYPMMYRDDPKNSKELNAWMDAYRKRFDGDADQYSATGYIAIGMLAQALQKAGPQPTADSVAAALEGVNYPHGFLGNPDYVFGPNKHLGAATVRMSQVRNGRWVVSSDYLQLK
ncbi:Leucine-, isoleucine-, valine-, threonine-, and alanine-binding protein precursor (plasmid) [Variovorax sp. SRS16]|uniref:ABC transporter substrate-binding protein n=1 Tax=Variovorax sp. SRS16 TaxID=282217 RepID=UPI001318EDED|nr:ABC transporter substrate-binding protein [Variovorax sp. SRS16]VTU45508.1 Leucine-, isoleucine-, valine-, threonine-, and alanine-binding protein precursor [Variovorax sp. SRS16]